MDLWIFDNDGTLYDDTQAHKQLMEILYRHCSMVLGVSLESVPEEIKKLKTKWNTEFSLIALRKEFGFDFSEMVNQTYLKIDLEKCGVPNTDPIRVNALCVIESPKIVFTNNSSAYARKVLKHIGLLQCFMDK